MQDMKSWSGKRWLAFLIQLAIVLLVLFGKWLGYSLNYIFGTASDSTTLLGVGRLLSDIGGLIGSHSSGSSGITLLAILIYALLGVGAWMCFQTMRSVFKAEAINPSGFTYGAILFAAMLLLVLIANGVVKSETDGWVPRLFTVNAAAYMVLLLSVLGILVCKRMTEAPLSAVNRVFSHPKSGAAAKDTPKRFCVKCGAAIRDAECRFCTACGASISSAPRCPRCGKKLEAGARFCPSCGTCRTTSAPGSGN